MFGLFRRKRRILDDPARALEAGDHDRAIALYRQRLTNAPKKSALWHKKIAEALVAAGRSDEAIREYVAAAAAYEDDGRIVQAIALYKAVFRIDPDNAEARKRLEAIAASPEERHQDSDDSQMTIRTRLRRYTPLFSEFEPDELTRIVDVMTPRSIAAGEEIFAQGDAGESLFVVVTGEVAFSVRGPEGEPVEVERVGDGAFFGEASVISRAPRNVTAIATRPTELLELTRDYLEAVAVAHPRVWEVLEEFARRRVLPVGI